MVIRLPNGRYAGQHPEGLVELIDIFPTVADVSGLAPTVTGSTYAQGHSLLSLLEGKQNHVRQYVFSDTRSPQSYNRGDRYSSVRDLRWKFVQVRRSRRTDQPSAFSLSRVVRRFLWQGPAAALPLIQAHTRRARARHHSGEFLYDLRSDPLEERNLVDDQPATVSKYRQLLEGWRQKNEELAQRIGGSPYSYEESDSIRQHFEELGYL